MTGLRMRFQLTPLLDLLLIVVFAQFLEGRQQDAVRAERAAERTEEKLERLDDARAELAAVRAELADRNEALQAERDRAVELARSAVRTARDVEAAADRSAGLLTDLLDVPPSVADALRPEPRSAAEEDLAAAEARVAALKYQKGFEVLRFLVGYEELLKRAEVWTLHVRGGGFVALSTGPGGSGGGAGGAVDLLRLEATGQRDRADEFVRKLFAATKALPQPKGLVVILVSFDRTARAGVYQPVLDGLGEAVRRLEADQGGRTQYEFAVLGAAPEPAATLDAAGTAAAAATTTTGEPEAAAGADPAAGGTLNPDAAPTAPEPRPNP